MKRRIISIFVTLTMLMALCATFTFSVSAAGNNPYICVPLSENAITIDGEKGTDYDKAVALPIERVIAMTDDTVEPTNGTAYIMWGKDQKLYFYVDVLDQDLSNSKDLIENFDFLPQNTDCVEIYAYYGNGEPVVMYRATYDGVLYCQQNAHRGDTKLINEEGEFSKNFECAIKQTETGYAAEFKISTYLANLCEGAIFPFRVVISSTDAVGSYKFATSNYGCDFNQVRYHTKAATTPQNYLNMMLVNKDGADANFHKYPTLSVTNIDENRYNDDKLAQDLTIREAVVISREEVVVKFNKPCTLQWFNNSAAFIGLSSSARLTPVANPNIDKGDAWQIGIDLPSAVTNDGGTTWKLKLFSPLYLKGDGSFANGVFRISETNGADMSLYQRDNSFIGQVISLDGNDYLHANREGLNDDWDVAYVEYTVNENYKWNSENETSLNMVEMEVEHTAIDENPNLKTNPLYEKANTNTGDNDNKTEDNTDNTTDDNNEDDDNKNNNQNNVNNNNDGNEFPWLIVVVAVVVIAVIAVVIVIVSKKKKK